MSSSSGSISSLPVPSKRIKMAAGTADKPKTGLYAASASNAKSSLPISSNKSRTALSLKSVTVLADKENIDPTGRRKGNNNMKDKSKSSISSNNALPPSKVDLWKGKQPFDYASPEKVPPNAKAQSKLVSSKYIYDLPGVEAHEEHVTILSASAETSSKPSKAAIRTIGSSTAVSRPNKKTRPIPAPLKGSQAFEIFRDDGAESVQEETFAIPRAGPSKMPPPTNRHVESLVHQHAFNSPVASVRDSDRRARELTESPLADVTLAYTGSGRFTNSPTVSYPLCM